MTGWMTIKTGRVSERMKRMLALSLMSLSATCMAQDGARSCDSDLVSQFSSFSFPALDTFYKTGSNSVVDSSKYETYQQASSQLSKLTSALATCANQSMRDDRTQASEIVVAALYALVERGPLRADRDEFQARVTGMMYGIGLGSAYAQVRGRVVNDSRISIIDRWFQAEARSSFDFFHARRINNLSYWSSTYAVLVGRLTSKPDLLALGRDGVSQGISLISEDGFKSEKRGQRTSFYNQYALAAVSWGLAFDSPGALRREYDKHAALAHMVSKSSSVTDGAVSRSQPANGYPSWCAPWQIVGLVSCDAVHGSMNFNRILGGDPGLLLGALWAVRPRNP